MTGGPVDIPVLELADWRSRGGTAPALAAGLRHALEDVGFFFVTGHGIDWSTVERTFAECRRFHALPEEAKSVLPVTRQITGYVGIGSGTTRTTALYDGEQANRVAAFLCKREEEGLNHWPAGLPGFRGRVLAYMAAVDALGQCLLPLYEQALGLPDGWLARRFAPADMHMRLAWYPAEDSDVAARDGFGVAPHTDNSFMTFLPQNALPGLWIRPAGCDWTEAPHLPGSFLVNSGDALQRWSGGRVLSTEHFVRNRSGRERVAIPLFYGPRADTVLDGMPHDATGTRPPRKRPAPVTYGDYTQWFSDRTYWGDDSPMP